MNLWIDTGLIKVAHAILLSVGTIVFIPAAMHQIAQAEREWSDRLWATSRWTFYSSTYLWVVAVLFWVAKAWVLHSNWFNLSDLFDIVLLLIACFAVVEPPKEMDGVFLSYGQRGLFSCMLLLTGTASVFFPVFFLS